VRHVARAHAPHQPRAFRMPPQPSVVQRSPRNAGSALSHCALMAFTSSCCATHTARAAEAVARASFPRATASGVSGDMPAPSS
jgi:hypothetical protein